MYTNSSTSYQVLLYTTLILRLSYICKCIFGAIWHVVCCCAVVLFTRIKVSSISVICTYSFFATCHVSRTGEHFQPTYNFFWGGGERALESTTFGTDRPTLFQMDFQNNENDIKVIYKWTCISKMDQRCVNS